MPQLDLSSLNSYSPKWSPALRLATCIATNYAVERCVRRAKALADRQIKLFTKQQRNLVGTSLEGSEQLQDQSSSQSAALELARSWEEYGQKFLTASCQHLGIQEEILPPGPTTLEDVIIAAQGREDEGPIPNLEFEPEIESGGSHVRNNPHLADPVGPNLAAAEGRSEMDRGDEEDLQERNSEGLDPFHRSESSAISADHVSVPCNDHSLPAFLGGVPTFLENFEEEEPEPSPRSKVAQHTYENLQAKKPVTFVPGLTSAPCEGIEGALEEGKGQELEVAHELLLVALGLGQFRSQDGSTTLFEQDMLFGDTDLGIQGGTGSEVHAKTGRRSHREDSDKLVPPPLPPRQHSSTAGSSSSLVPESDIEEQKKAKSSADRRSATFLDLNGTGKMFAGASKTAFGAIAKGATNGWDKVATVSMDIFAPGTEQPHAQQQQIPRRARKPVKPNEICHYDAKARAIIFVAITAMGIHGKQVWLAEKVMAQSIYFIMEEGRQASTSKGGKDLIDGLPAGASLDPKTGTIRQASGCLDEVEGSSSSRSEWMNEHSTSAVAREKGKASWGKWAATAGGFVAGGLLIGVTGGLAAPIVAPALVGLTGVSFLATSGGIIMLGTLFGLGGGGLASYRVRRRLQGIESFEFVELENEARKAGVNIPSLHASICCSGLILEEEEQIRPWQRAFSNSLDARDAFAIKCESKMMTEAGTALRGYLIDQILRSGGKKAVEEVLKRTALASFAALSLPLTVMGAASATLDGAFVRAKTKSHKAGLILAETLKKEVQGHRPVVLIGTSLGAATILSALLELSKDPAENSHLVDSVYLISAPITPSPSTLRKARSVVQRRFVNAFSSKDMVCRIAAWLGTGINVEELRNGSLPRVAGSKGLEGIEGVENVNVEDIILGHFEVNDNEKLLQVLQRCGALDE
ncbi:DUF726-domain-containing protein [Violaceomyces palustris]|uniref:DUF726-domain-containing protein n=1 Tax=Violaceomyces palustris TaxID=1673888 RepID=A0ACD0P721_9BASI|nr:DUF726-domain-containing protein [Violaceomyces palustris]